MSVILMPKTGVKIERNVLTTTTNPQFPTSEIVEVFNDLVGLEVLTGQKLAEFNTNYGTQAKVVIHAILPPLADVREGDIIKYNPTRFGDSTAFDPNLTVHQAQLMPPLKAIGITIKHIEIYATS